MSKSLLGVNIEPIKDWERTHMFIDMMKQARKFGSANAPWDGKCDVGSDGWPTTAFGLLLKSEAVASDAGTYKLSFTGKANVKPLASPTTVKNIKYTASSNVTTADLEFSPGAAGTGLTLSFDAPVKNVKVLRPGYTSDAAIFTNEFLKLIEPFGGIRLMDYFDSNSPVSGKWSDRVTTATPSYAINGGPWEVAIELANKTGKDVWVCIPYQADDDYLNQLAKLLKEKVAATSTIYIEWSNEVWNWSFPQANYNKALAIEEAKTDKTFIYSPWSNDLTIAFSRVGKVALKIARLFKGDKRFRIVLASQHVWTDTLKAPIECIKENLKAGEKISDYIYGLAIAPYFEAEVDFLKKDNLTVDDFFGPYNFDVLDKDGKVVANRKGNNIMMEQALKMQSDVHVKEMIQVAKDNNLVPMAYEGNITMHFLPFSVPAKIAVQQDPRVAAVNTEYLDGWFRQGGKQFFFYLAAMRSSQAAYLGLTEDVGNLTAPKYVTAKAIAAKYKDGSTPTVPPTNRKVSKVVVYYADGKTQTFSWK